MGYHPGAEDDGIYLSAVRSDLNPALYPHDSAFFKLQMRTSVFDNWMADFVRATHISATWSELLWQAVSIVLFVWACWKIVCVLFEEPAARWGGLAMASAMFTLPVTGTAIFILDQYMHPRNLATALILLAAWRVIEQKKWQAAPLLALAFVLHPMMGALGISFCTCQAVVASEWIREKVASLFAPRVPENEASIAGLIPFGWIFEPPSRDWQRAMRHGGMFRFYDWPWYELLGVFAPIAIFGLLIPFARRQNRDRLAVFAAGIFVYAVLQQAFASIILAPRAWVGLSTLEPMRYLQLVYLFMALIAGAYLGLYLLKAKTWRWAVFLILTNGSMFFVQRQLFAATPHIEMPTAASNNDWLQAFSWIRDNTPPDAYFALDPMYLAAPGEDYHSFRALAERSQLADGIKDTSMISKVPELASTWAEQVDAQAGWRGFGAEQFRALKQRFGVDWVLVSYPAQTTGLDCQWHNATLGVCRVP